MTYSQMLRMPQWQRKRYEIMNRDDFRCAKCGTDSVCLNVHHKFYITGRDPWDYDNDALVTLCENCHTAAHGKPVADHTPATPEVKQPIADTEDGLECAKCEHTVEFSRVEFLLCEFLVEHEHDDEVLDLVEKYLPCEALQYPFTVSVVTALLKQRVTERDLLADLCRTTDAEWQPVLGSIIANKQKMLNAREATPAEAAQDLIKCIWVLFFKAKLKEAREQRTPECGASVIAYSALVKKIQVQEWTVSCQVMNIAYAKGVIPCDCLT